MKDDPSMRLGYKWLSVSDKRFMGAMHVHDWAYRAGSAAQKSEMTRKEVDDRFLEMCLRAAGDDWWARRRAYFYYRCVRLFGGFLWENKETV